MKVLEEQQKIKLLFEQKGEELAVIKEEYETKKKEVSLQRLLLSHISIEQAMPKNWILQSQCQCFKGLICFLSDILAASSKGFQTMILGPPFTSKIKFNALE